MGKQNTSHAVMAQRNRDLDHTLDFYPTPAWATRALCEYVLPEIACGDSPRAPLRDFTVWEPACGQGHMARPLAEYFGQVHASDLHDYGFGQVHDFTRPLSPSGFEGRSDWIITNPPFKHGQAFVDRALDECGAGCAMLLRTVFLEGVERYSGLFSKRPPAIVAPFCERVPMVKGRVDAKASSATSYTWFVWARPRSMVSRVLWIPPCRKAFERPEDYQGQGGSDAGV